MKGAPEHPSQLALPPDEKTIEQSSPAQKSGRKKKLIRLARERHPLVARVEYVLFVALFSFLRWLSLPVAFRCGEWIGLLLYHMSIHIIYKQQLNDRHFYTSQQLRLWNEVATLFLVAIVMLAVVKSILNLFWASVGFVGFILVLLLVIRIYRNIRKF